MNGLLKRLLKGASGDQTLSYAEAKELAGNEDIEVRRELAARTDIKPEILYFLAEDPDPEVRRRIAANEMTPVHANLLLASDTEDGVRGDLAEKIAALAPGLSATEQDKMRRMVFEALDVLARDQVTRVRRILSEALKDVADAPPEVIRRLARDAELVVAGPVLQYSPVLSEEDLLEIIEANPASGPLGAISRRDGVAESVADAIVATDDEDAVALLLANSSAQIREETLDKIIDQALDIESWHEPLVYRPALPGRAAAKLARFVAHILLEALKERQDLEPDVLEQVRQVVEKRLSEDQPETAAAEKSTPEEALEKATGLHEAGKLDEEAVSEALLGGDREFSIAALAVLSGLKGDVVRKVVSTRSAKGMLAITWKAGLSAKLAESLQKKLALVAGKDLLRAEGADFPLDDAALEWQLDFIKDIA
ncbi:MAG: DUF2336 domain-containing protein [Proteobacteria bacterium]|nr:DUF2336 domain-containing protein [Pseudomonadota bacterium]